MLPVVHGCRRLLKMDQLRSDVLAWTEEIRCMTKALRFVVRQFGSDVEELSYSESVLYPEALMIMLEQWTRGAERNGTARPNEKLIRFAGFSEGTARAISPLLETVVVHEPGFIEMARQLHESEPIRLSGMFLGIWARYVCEPVWESFPAFAPPGWKLKVV
jgi:hypothetical protein